MNKKMAQDSWRTTAYRQSVVAQIDKAIRKFGTLNSKSSMEMENLAFQKAKTKEEYLGFVARQILHVPEMRIKDNQIMGIGVPQNPVMIPQPTPQISATNLLQTLNQRPGQGLPGLPTLPNKMPEMAMGGSQVGAMGQMLGQLNQMPGQMATQIRMPMPGQMAGQMPGQMASQMQNQMGGQMPGQMPGQIPGQMPGQMTGQIPHIAQMAGRKEAENIMMLNQMLDSLVLEK